MKPIPEFPVRAFLLATAFTLHPSSAQTAGTASSVNPSTVPAPTAYAVVSRDANSQVWERTVFEPGPSGQTVARKHRYTELASGLNYLDTNGQYVPSQEQIEAFAGGAIARQGQYQVIFANNLNSAGAIDLQTPDGKRLRSNILGLMYYDPATGDAVQIAQIQDSEGGLIATNQVLYPNAFAGVKADVLYTYRRDGMEQDVILREQLPVPEALGMNSATVELEVFTEFQDAPAASVGAMDSNEPGLDPDETVSWGATSLGRGKAFNLGGEDSPATVVKRYVNIQGRYFLQEKVKYQDIQAALVKLPEQASNERRLPMMASKTLVLPKTPTLKTAARPIRLAAATPSNQGYVLDYVTVNAAYTGYTFQSDTTYYISSPLGLYGTNTFEGGTVIKYAAGMSIMVEPEIFTPMFVFKSGAYRPVVFTAKDDNTIGESISGSTGNPSGYYANPALSLTFMGVQLLNGLRISYAGTAISCPGIPVTLDNAQFVNCGVGVSVSGSTVNVNNALFLNVNTNFSLTGAGAVVAANNVTFDNAQFLASPTNYPSGSYLQLTNCILANVTNVAGTVYAGYNGFYNTPTFGSTIISTNSYPFQTAGGASHYLATNCVFANVGTTSIDANLLASLRSKTTYPPIIYYTPGTYFSSTLNLSPQAQRDTDVPDLGYHYDPLDYIFGPTYVTNATITAHAGTAIGIFATNSYTYGLALANNAQFHSQGAPNNLNHVVEYNTVQEQTPAGWKIPSYGLVAHYNGTNFLIDCGFTDWSVMAQDACHVQIGSINSPITLQNCQFHGGTILSYSSAISLVNCLLERVNVDIEPADSSTNVFRNDLFWGGTFSFFPALTNAVIIDNLFDRTAIPDGLGGDGVTYIGGHNAYVTNCDELDPVYPGDMVLSNSPAYVTSWLGNYYLPYNYYSPLIDAGSTTADKFGLYHFTMQNSQVPEGSSVVDIGYHYVALDKNGMPIDSNSDGIPDYLEDGNGNGIVDSGETDWQSDGDYDGVGDAQELVDGTDPNDPDSAEAIMLGYWRFNSTNLASEAGQLPMVSYNTLTPASWSGTSVYINTTSGLAYPETALNGNGNINCRNGTVRFWFKPHWSSSDTNLGSTIGDARFIELGNYGTDGWWVLNTAAGENINFQSRNNDTGETYFSLPFQFVSNLWCQLTLTYTPTNIAFYTNGILATTCIEKSDGDFGYPASGTWYGNDVGAGIYNYPSEAIRATGFYLGSSQANPPINGEFDELQTYNYALTARQVAQGFPGFNGAANVMQDSDYDGRSDLLEQYADGTGPNDPGSVLPTRLGYWRFNDSSNTGEMGQMPILAYDVANTPSWSGESLVISSDANSRLIYRDVETNGWANFNCRNGAVRFWFKPNWSSGTGPTVGAFISMGTNANFWALYANAAGSQIGFALNTPAFSTNFFSVPYPFNSSQWCQIVFNYSPTNLALYVNGTLLVSTPVSNWNWPALSARTNGLVVGNVTGYSVPINGQFDELETFNYNLGVNEITRSFNAVKSVDSDLNGVADLLEDLILTNSVPFMGVPFPVTGVFEAEQFDVGGPNGSNAAYHALDSTHATTGYRCTQLDITNCDDLGGGWCVDKLRVGEWLKYTMDVGLAQTYAVEARVEGIGTNGVFKIEFSTNGVFPGYASTGPLMVTSTNWMNVTFKNIPLVAGTNVMKVTMLTNGLVGGGGSGYVMKFNYTSIYPSWNEGVTNTNVITVTGLTNNLCDWMTASSNTLRIQFAIDQAAAAGGGIVAIQAGTYYVAAREITDESNYSIYNTADFIYPNNVVIQGAGKTNTILVAHNRAVTIFYVGFKFNGVGSVLSFAVTNFALQDLTLEASPHWVYDATNTNQRTWEDGALWRGAESFGFPGCLMRGNGVGESQPMNNVLVTRCRFENSPSCDISIPYATTHFLSISNDFLYRVDGTNGGYTGQITDHSRGTTVSNDTWGVAIFVNPSAAQNNNLDVVACNFNGHVNPTNTDTSFPADGILWCQSEGGNWFAARNTITNYGLEAIQWNSGPAAAVQNSFSTYISTPSTCALNNPVAVGAEGPTGQRNDLSFSFTGNTVVGGQEGVLSVNSNPSTETSIADLLVSGNSFDLDWTLPVYADWPGAVGMLWWVDKLDASGNTLIGGEQGIAVLYALTNAVILGNDFTAANLRSVDTENMGGNVVGAIQNAQLIKNKLAGGDSFQVRAPLQDGTHYFLLQNQYVTTNGVPTGMVTEPQSLPIHYQP